jgi:peptidoglycan hydrolase-like protein with peptidoglycan-binding domain
MGVIEDAVAWAIETANDQSHGYSQADRWGPDYDCSSFVINAFEQAGVSLREAGASYTGNMRGPMISCGFVDVTYSIGLDSGYGLQPGDVLLNYAAHTCICIGGGKVANCRTDEGHPQSGDQSGNEIRIQSYWNFPWDCVLRYKGSHIGSNVSGPDTLPGAAAQPRTVLRRGMMGTDVKDLQEQLTRLGYDCGKADGIYGSDTFRAVACFQEDHGLEVDGIAGRMTKDAIEEAIAAPKDQEPPAAAPDPADQTSVFWLPDLQLGDKGPAVTLLQAALTIRGCDCGSQDGIFGPKTQAALNRYKESRQLAADGTVDRKTWNLLLGVES